MGFPAGSRPAGSGGTEPQGPIDSTEVIDASAAGGPTVAASLDALVGDVGDVQGHVDAVTPTDVAIDNFAVGTQPNYTTLLTFALAEGRSYTLSGELELVQTSPLRSSAIDLKMCARRPSGEGASVSTPIVPITGSITNLQAAWEASGNNVLLRLRAPGGPTVDVTGRYFWRAKVVPS